jgi:uncharacterized protein involved in exopolysaccharide biosynthesis
LNTQQIIHPEAALSPVLRVGQILWKRRLLTGATFCLVAGATMAIAFKTHPSFNASASLMVGPGSAEHSSEAAPRMTRMIESFVRIAGSEEVVRDAVEKVGLEKLIGPPKGSAQIASGSEKPGAFDHWLNKLRQQQGWLPTVWPETPAAARNITPIEQAMPEIVKALTIKAELSSDIVNISFKHKNPLIAAEFANAVAEAFIDRQLHLFSTGKTAQFYDQQVALFNAEVKSASENFEQFMVANGAYSIDQQKELLLKRSSELSTALLATRAAIADKSGQAEALAAQLHKLKPVAQSTYTSSVVDSLAGARAADPAPTPVARPRELNVGVGETTPLLMVKVFQDSVVLLFKTNAELKGLNDLESEQSRQLEGINAELAKLVSKEAEYNRLAKAVSQASQNADIYAKRAADENVNANMSAAKFSDIKIVQYAYAPLKSNFPGYPVLGLIALANGLIFAVGAALTTELLASRNGKRLAHDLANVWERDIRHAALREGAPAK